MASSLKDARVLVAGVGGIGNFVAKILLDVGILNLTLVDMDTADTTNLNRQLLFSASDVGKSKAEAAADKLRSLYPSATIIAHNCRLQDLSAEFYTHFDVIFAGLDNVESRRWLNAAIFNITTVDNPMPIMIDGGTDGLFGHCRVIIPHHSPCFECTIENFASDGLTVPLCTIAQKPRSNRHCILKCALITWPELFGDRPLDLDRDMDWLDQAGDALCNELHFPLLSRSEKADLFRRVVPAIAGTNHVVAGLMVQKGLQLLETGLPLTAWHWNYDATCFPCLAPVSIIRNNDCIVCGGGDSVIIK